MNRVGDRYFDQIERSGHAGRVDDIDRLADLGVRAVRYPLLWERIEPDGPGSADWTWADARLARLRDRGIRPIVGLVHHGSGPRHTSLLDPEFPAKLAAFARRVAERYPWIDDWTPVNEPLTTARFAALYGHWYPHRQDAWSFARALITQCEGVRQAMRAVREVVPHARLVQTEDLGRTYSTPPLAYQARFENDRRWVTFDLLTGRLTPRGTLWRYLAAAGVPARALELFRDAPATPILLGVNHYVTSERFLDHRIEHYPPETHGGNGRHSYADVEAVRVCAEGTAGPATLLQEAWDRYGVPIAVTEVHLGCTREQQLRWLDEVWDAANAVRARGGDVHAVTAWSSFGAFDWNSLLTRDGGHYEPGLFDVRGPTPRPTALARMVRGLATAGEHDHPALDGAGWWREDVRLLYPAVRAEERRVTSRGAGRGAGRTGARDVGRGTHETDARACGTAVGAHPIGGHASHAPQARVRFPLVPRTAPLSVAPHPVRVPRPLLITGATGTLGRAFARLCAERGLAYHLLSRGGCDIADAASVASALDGLRPWAVVNTAGYVRVDDAEDDRARCFRENAQGAAVLAAACARRGMALVTFSSDLVFDGAKGTAYVEGDAVRPLCVYGESKAAAEGAVLDAHTNALVVRTSAFFGPWDEHNFAALVLGAVARGEEFIAADDAVVSPTYVPDLVHAALDLLVDGATGVWHLANGGAVTWAGFGQRAAACVGLDASLVVGRPAATLGLRAARPGYSALSSERGLLLPSLENAICRYADARWAVARAPESVRPQRAVQQLA